MRGGAHSHSRVLPLPVLAVALALALAACGKEAKHGGILPIDTAAIMPIHDTSTGIGIGIGDSAHGVASGFADSLATTAYGTGDAAISVVPAADSAAGYVIFHGKGRCFTCHGERGQGTPQLGSTLADDDWLSGNGSLAWIGDVIAHGVTTPSSTSVAMPAYAGMLSAHEMGLTAAYVYALSHPRPTAPDSAVADTLANNTSRSGSDSARSWPTFSHSALPRTTTPPRDGSARRTRLINQGAR